MRAFAATLAAVGLLCLSTTAADDEPMQIKVDHPVFCLAVSPDGKTIFAGGPQKKIDSNDPASAFQPGKVTLLDAKTGKVLRSFQTENPAPAVAVSPDGKRLLTGDFTRFGILLEGKKGSVFPRVWEVESGKPAPLELDGHKDTITGVAFFPDGKRLITASGDGTARIWDADSGKELLVLKTDHFNNGLSLSKDGKRVAVAGEDTKLTVWDADTGKEAFLLDIGYSAERAAFAPDGSLVAVCSRGTNDITLWDGTGSASKGAIVARGSGNVTSNLLFSPDGKWLVTGNGDWAAESKPGVVTIWDVGGKKKHFELKGHPSRIETLAFTPDGTTLISASDDGTLLLWDFAKAVKGGN